VTPSTRSNRSESRRVLATLIRLLGDFDIAEEALHEAFRRPSKQWPVDGVPANPRAWLVSTGRFKAIDDLRRHARFDALDESMVERPGETGHRRAARRGPGRRSPAAHLHVLPSACLRMRRVALTCGGVRAHDGGDRARVPDAAPTLAQRIVRAKTRSRRAHPLSRCRSATPSPSASTACCVSSTSCSTKVIRRRRVLAHETRSLGEAIRLGRLLVELLPEPRPSGCSR
jgi:RNA polymerase sigma-70 factor (ECF subfamily)